MTGRILLVVLAGAAGFVVGWRRCMRSSISRVATLRRSLLALWDDPATLVDQEHARRHFRATP